MTKSDLKTGMVIETNEGSKFLVIKHKNLGLVGVSNDEWLNLNKYSEDLIGGAFTIIKVYIATKEYQLKEKDWNEMKLIWQRPAEKTPEQIKIEELEKTINTAQRQIEELKRG